MSKRKSRYTIHLIKGDGNINSLKSAIAKHSKIVRIVKPKKRLPTKNLTISIDVPYGKEEAFEKIARRLRNSGVISHCKKVKQRRDRRTKTHKRW